VLRVLRLVKRAKKLQIIAQTVLEAIPSMGSLGVLLLLFLFLFAVIGNQLFSFVKLQGDLNRQFNFQTFTSSFLLLVRCATGEGWNALMFDTARQRSVTF
jgi:voltage-dependent calcium channel L type alpha-1C/voltage-dependent calcium channel L type alpha-1D